MKTKHHYLKALIQIVLFGLFFLLHYNGIFTIKLLKATPMLLIPMLITFCMFNEELTSVLVGLVTGIFIDSVSIGGSYLHTILFFLISLAASLSAHYLLNNNFRTALLMSILASLLYFTARWLFFYAIGENIIDSANYLLQYALPSVIYTNIFTVPLYFLQRYLNKHKDR